MEKDLEIHYHFRFSNGREKSFNLTLDPQSMHFEQDKTKALPSWTALEFHQCPNCPLNKENHPHCPLAVELIDSVEFSKDLASTDGVHVEVITSNRTISLNTDAQTAISSLMGVIMATSCCPHTLFLRPMARFHLPFADEIETAYRAVSMYLLSKYFLSERGGAVDLSLEGLNPCYEKIHIVNMHIAKRILSVSGEDSAVNALTKLDVYSLILPRKIRSSLKNIARFFDPHMEKSISPPIEPT